MYDNERCRLCGSNKEDLDHVINHCSELQRNTVLNVANIFTISEAEIEILTEILQQFKRHIGKKNVDATNQTVEESNAQEM